MAAYACVLFDSCMQVLLKAAPPVGSLSDHPGQCVCLCSASLLFESANGKVAAMSLSLGRDLTSLGTRLGSSAWAGGSWAGGGGCTPYIP